MANPAAPLADVAAGECQIFCVRGLSGMVVRADISRPPVELSVASNLAAGGLRRSNIYGEAASCRTASVTLLSSSSGRTAGMFLTLSSEWYARTASNGLI